jgi:hypothetical protein
LTHYVALFTNVVIRVRPESRTAESFANASRTAGEWRSLVGIAPKLSGQLFAQAAMSDSAL